MKSNLIQIYQSMLNHFGSQHWWPADSHFEIMVGAILTQNTNWQNVSRALEQLKQVALLDPPRMHKIHLPELAGLIRSSGYYNQKAIKLKNLLDWYASYDYDRNQIWQVYPRGQKNDSLRSELLAIKGIGPETADSILCYALEMPYFVVDAYTMRIFTRYGLIPDRKPGYAMVQQQVESSLAATYAARQLTAHFNELHALIVVTGNQFCRKKNPGCTYCPLGKSCSQSL